MNTNNGGATNIDVLSVGALYINGQRFRDIVSSLIAEDTLEQEELDLLRTLLANLKTDGLTSEWIVNNENKNAVLKTAITAIETKLAKIDTTTLTETSVLTNDNRNSVLKTRLDTAEGDIDNVENKTRFITEASVAGTGDLTTSTYTTSVGPPSGDKGISIIELKQKNAPGTDFIGYRITSDFDDDDYDYNESLYSHPHGRITMKGSTIRIQATEQIRIGGFSEYGDSLGGAVNIGGRGSSVNIGAIDALSSGSPCQIQIGKQSDSSPNTSTRISGNVYLSDARFEDMTKSSSITIGALVAFMSAGAPSWVIGFFGGNSLLPYSDVWCMKGGFAGTKNGSIETRNSIMLEELYVVNKAITNITSKIGFWMAKADYSCTQLIGDHRTQTFAGDITIRNNNITSTSVDWALTGANDKCNVVNIGGNSGILIHQGASSNEEPLRIINSCKGMIELRLTKDGTKSGGEGLSLRHLPGTISNSGTETFVRIGTYMGGANGTAYGSYALEVNQYNGAAGRPETARDGMVIAKAVFNGVDFTQLLNVINADSINTPGTITGINLVGSNSLTTNQATATSLVVSGNYTGDTTNRLYKNADGKLFWNGTELGANVGGGGGGLEYYIPLANNVTNPAPSPTTQVATETYTNANQRTITQSTTAVNTGILMAKYATSIINKESNPFVEGIQTIQQHITWNQSSIVGQIYGQAWFQASASGAGAFIYDRSFTGVGITNGYQVLNGVPILAPQGLFNLTFQSVTFPGIKVDTFSSLSITMKCRLEAETNGTWATLQTSTGSITYTLDNQENQTITFNETFTHNQTSKTNAPTAYRMVLFLTTPQANGQIHQQTFAGSTGNDLIAYKLGSTTGNTAEIRVLLYDGVNAKQTIAHASTTSLVPIELPISPPYQIGAFNNGRLGFDIYMFQPSGAVNAGHQMTFYFGDGTISHIETTINEPPAPTPTLAQVLTSGATASAAINMNTNKISGITSLEGSSNGNWNVKEITAGTNISKSVTNGNYTITNDAPCQELSAGFGIQLGQNTTTKTYTIYNNAAVQNLQAGNGISLEIDTPTRTATITNTAATTLPVVIASTARDEHQTLMEVGALPRKPDYWAKNWSIADAQVRSHRDMYVSVDGKIIASASGNFAIRYSKDYGTTWADGTGATGDITWTSICGTSSGSKLFAFGVAYRNNVYTLLLYTSVNQGATWTQITSSAFSGPIEVNRVRCSGEGTYLLASDATQITEGRLLYSINGGVTWSRSPLSDLPAGSTTGVCMSRSGAIQFIVWVNTALTDSRIFRSLDYGYTFSQVQGNISDGGYFNRLECDATGRFVYATRFSSITAMHHVYRSDNYGETWGSGLASGQEEVWVSATGQFVMMVSNAWAWNAAPWYGYIVSYSSDYGRPGTFDNNYTLMGQNTIRTINGSGDGSVLVLGSVNQTEGGVAGDGKIRIARSGIVNPYDRLFSMDVILWYSGALDITTQTNKINLPFTSAGKIDLANYNIKYEIDINWNLETSETSPSHPTCFISMGFQSNTITTPNARVANTIWTRKAQTTINSFPNELSSSSNDATHDQSFHNVFLCGYATGQWIGDLYRYRSLMKGEISRVTTRPAQYTNDFAVNSRTIMNRFNADCILYDAESGASALKFYTNILGDGQGQIQIEGTAFWEMAYNNLYNDIASGIDNIFINLHNGIPGSVNFYSNVLRRGYITYRIYRVRK